MAKEGQYKPRCPAPQAAAAASEGSGSYAPRARKAGDQAERDHELRRQLLALLGGVPAHFRQALREHGSPAGALEALAAKDSPRRPAALACEVASIAPGEPDWPEELDALADPPGLLFVEGRWPSARPRLAIVGSRSPDAYGLDATRVMAAVAAEAGWTVVSGGARGVDTAAHEATLEAGGTTIAVLGGGFERPYPAENRRLFRRIAERGALLAEYPPWRRPRPAHFPERNRLVAGLAEAVLVTQARQRSGALATARLGRALRRPVLAVPGDLGYRLSAGVNALLATGAVAVCGPRHLVALLAELATGSPAEPVAWPRDPEPGGRRAATETVPVAPAQPRGKGADVPTWMAAVLGDGRWHPVDEVVAGTGKPTGAVLRACATMEVAGELARDAVGRVRWTAPRTGRG